MNENNRAINVDDILIWIIQNQHNTDAMDKINRATYSYTSKFKVRASQGLYPSVSVEGSGNAINK